MWYFNTIFYNLLDVKSANRCYHLHKVLVYTHSLINIWNCLSYLHSPSILLIIHFWILNNISAQSDLLSLLCKYIVYFKIVVLFIIKLLIFNALIIWEILTFHKTKFTPNTQLHITFSLWNPPPLWSQLSSKVYYNSISLPSLDLCRHSSSQSYLQPLPNSLTPSIHKLWEPIFVNLNCLFLRIFSLNAKQSKCLILYKISLTFSKALVCKIFEWFLIHLNKIL